MKKIFIALLLTICVFVIKAQQTDNNNFAFELYKKLSENNSNNIVFSPYSISQSLAMVYCGAEGNNRYQMQKVMGFDADAKKTNEFFGKTNKKLTILSDTVSLLISNQLLIQKDYTFLSDYLLQMKNKYQAKMFFVNFKSQIGIKKAVCKVNKSVKKHTRGNIKQLINKSKVSELTKLIITNAIWFDAEWKYAFEKENTTNKTFNNIDGTKTQLPMMYQKTNFDYYENKTLKAIKIPYKGNKINMLIILPKEVDNFAISEKELCKKNISSIEKNMKLQKVELSIPKFNVSSGFELKKTLMQMGMVEAFNNKADFSLITGNKELKIDKVIHKTIIDVSEKGTEVAAATAVIMIRKSAFVKNVFFADKPFIYIIKDNENNIILVGKFVNAKK